MVYSSSREAAAIELVLGLIDEAHESVEAHWQWPSTFVDYKELDDDYKELGDKAVNGWYETARYEQLVQAVRNIWASTEGKTGLSVLALNRVLEKWDEVLVVPKSALVGRKYDPLFEYVEGVPSDGAVEAPLGSNKENRRVRCVAGVASRNVVSLRARLAALDEEVELLRMEKRVEEKRGGLFGWLGSKKFW